MQYVNSKTTQNLFKKDVQITHYDFRNERRSN